MGKFKTENGKSRVGNFLTNAKEVGVKFAPGLLDLVANITGVEALSNLGDMIKGDKEMDPITKAAALAQLDFDRAEMAELTKRHEADMNSDSWLSKNIRPIILAYSWLLISVVLCARIFSPEFVLPAEYLESTLYLCGGVNIYYFGERGYNKAQERKKVN